MCVQCIHNVCMNTAVINFRVDPKVKSGAKAFANSLGLNLSTLIDGYLKYLVKNKAVIFTADGAVPVYKASKWLDRKTEKALKEVDKAVEVEDIHEFFKNL